MVIGIGLHCWYCEHGPCTGECHVEEKQTRESYLEEENQKLKMENRALKVRHEQLEKRCLKYWAKLFK
jgi:hypothetical protein